ncbi:MAG: type II toxin-antitoxin system HicA family toxin [Chloroflexi bacterium]|nr:type II toxin-antitoxin system HicA family toxin [Chloroflexota bacterium]MBU1662887.1 type II toxin-antitoxin system HicA family toxin [Chloroflexota bacterium]
MSRLSPLKPHQVIHKLQKLGYEGPYPGGRHVRMVHEETGQIVPIPMHKGKDVSVGLIRAIIRQVGITPEEWKEL